MIRHAAVALEPLDEDDLPALHAIVSEPEVNRYLDLIPPIPLQKTREFAATATAGGGRIWGIRVDGMLVGAVGILPGEPGTKLSHSASLFIYLTPRCWGRGIGSAALQAALGEAERLGFERIEALVAESNVRALGLFQQNGFAVEGRLRRAFKTGSEYQDLILLAKLL
ncbi:MAG: GNAT family N-acetyltransferase [Methanomicrobiales archaeon]|nr:GNAT family N-acetyltransferase [Methanomicrobiales archaeon]MDI6875450.1 GNAT family N-acetyltransferase [Methanomicrobiales archaeon]